MQNSSQFTVNSSRLAPASEPSTREREEFFSGPAVYPPETVPGSIDGSAHAVQATAAERSGGGSGGRPLSAPAPMRIRETEDDGCVVRLTPADALAIKREQEALDRRDALLIELAFAARDLAENDLTGMGAGDFFCYACHDVGRHAPGCKAKRVLDALDALAEQAPAANLGGAR